jgi:hypothetical protein
VVSGSVIVEDWRDDAFFGFDFFGRSSCNMVNLGLGKVTKPES